jgi:CubicO group peptidase (beta-lactamase class C family)
MANRFTLSPHSLFAILLVVLQATACLPVAEAQSDKLSPEKRAQIEAAVSKFMAEKHIPGVSVAVVENAEFVWSSGFGMADMENFVPATSSTLYRLASISKAMTAVGAMQLFERGKLDLDAPAQKYCPAFPQKDTPITTREVMGHIAGNRHYRPDPATDLATANTRHFDNPIEGGLSFFKDDPLVSKPGREFHYSTQGYTLVGCVIEGASGQKYVDYMREHVFDPAGMASTQPDQRFSIIPHRTRFYDLDSAGRLENANFLDSSYKIPGGGYISSADDMARFEVAILHDKLLRRVTRDLMWTPLKPSDGSADDYGLGWGTGKGAGVPDVGHTGGQPGTSTAMTIAPQQQAGVIVLMNLENGGAGDLATELLKIVVGTAGKDTSQKK